MIQLLSRCWLVAALGAVAIAAGTAGAGSCGAGGCGGGSGIVDPGFDGNWGWFNRAWVFPYAGYTLYPGEVGSCFPSHSDYSHINWIVPPTITAQRVLDKLRELDIPRDPPETIYLNKNPRITEGVKLPIPKGWTVKEPEKKPKEIEKTKDKPKEIEKPKGK